MSGISALIGAVEKKRLPIQQGVLSWSVGNPPRYPWRHPGRTAYEVLIGELWLEKATYAAVPTFEHFIQCFPSIYDLAKATEDELAKVLSDLHLQQHNKEIIALAENLLREGEGNLPDDSEVLTQISGLEHHNISAVLCFGYSLPVSVVDSNVRRMLSRIFSTDVPPQPPLGLIKSIGESLVPYGNPEKYNSALLDLAELKCRFTTPLCAECPVGTVCDSASGRQAAEQTNFSVT